MKKHSLVIPLFLCLFLAAPSVCAQTMSDQQVLEYVKQGMAEGKDQRQLATELARRGVTREQAERVKKLYEQQQGVNASQMSGTELNEARLREAVKEDTSTALETPQPDAAELARARRYSGGRRNRFAYLYNPAQTPSTITDILTHANTGICIDATGLLQFPVEADLQQAMGCGNHYPRLRTLDRIILAVCHPAIENTNSRLAG